MISAAVTVTDLPNAGQPLTSAASTAQVVKLDQFTISLTSQTGVQTWRCYPASQTTLLDWNGSAGWTIQTNGNTGTALFTMNLVAPRYDSSIPMISEVSDGNNVSYFPFTLVFGSGKAMAGPHLVRGVATTALAAYTALLGTLTTNATGAPAAATTDGLTLVAGDRFLLPPGCAASTHDAGIYVVAVAGTTGVTAIYQRPSDWATGSSQYVGTRIDVEEGTLFGGTTWKVTNVVAGTEAVIVDTNGLEVYPLVVTQSLALVSGAVNVKTVPILSATKTQVSFSVVSPVGITSTVQYGVALPAGITAGDIGTASVTLIARVAAGTVNTGDTSTGAFTIINQL